VSDFDIWISISSMVFFLVICVLLVTMLLKKGYNIKS
jgi:ABC-2 type transport system permease protein